MNIMYAHAVSKVPDPKTGLEYLFKCAVDYTTTKTGLWRLKADQRKVISKGVLQPTT